MALLCPPSISRSPTMGTLDQDTLSALMQGPIVPSSPIDDSHLLPIIIADVPIITSTASIVEPPSSASDIKATSLLAIGDRAPNFALPRVANVDNGASAEMVDFYSLFKHKGSRGVVVHFRGAWCAACLAQSRSYRAMVHEYARLGYEFVTVTSADDESLALEDSQSLVLRDSQQTVLNTFVKTEWALSAIDSTQSSPRLDADTDLNTTQHNKDTNNTPSCNVPISGVFVFDRNGRVLASSVQAVHTTTLTNNNNTNTNNTEWSATDLLNVVTSATSISEYRYASLLRMHDHVEEESRRIGQYFPC